jgi:hypothetical protein
VSNTRGSTSPSGGRKYSTSLILGLLFVPVSAVMAVALVSPSSDADTGIEEQVAAVPETTIAAASATTTTAGIFEYSSHEDLVAACGPEGIGLVEREAAGSISPLEQAALDSLRAICETEGMPLPGPPAPAPIVKVVATPASTPATTTGTDPGNDTNSNPQAAAFEQAYAETVSIINDAIDAGGKGEKIREATRELEIAAAAADAGNYSKAMEKIKEARKKAAEAMKDREDDDGDGDGDGDEDDD